MKKTVKIIYTFAVISSLATFGTFFYPTVSDAWNRYVSSRLISEYVSNKEETPDYTEEYENAVSYNRHLLEEGENNISSYSIQLSGDTSKEENKSLSGEVVRPDHYYESILNVSGNGMMGYIEIPAIHVSLPIYHYASEEILGKGIGHLYGSSLPVGGKGTHAVLTGHCGLMDARLFTDLENLKEGDSFSIHVLDKDLRYQVDQIKIVLPNVTEDLSIDKNEDFVTLMTCTPYGINSHRLLVRGKRMPDNAPVEKEEHTVLEDAQDIARFPVSIFVLAAVCITAHIAVIFKIWRKSDET